MVEVPALLPALTTMLLHCQEANETSDVLIMNKNTVGLIEISIQHESSQELEFRDLTYDFATLKARIVHKK
jgi:hypothetical protein